MRKTALILLCAVFFTATPFFVKKAEAAQLSAYDLLRLCASKNNNDIHICAAYISGIIDYHNLARSLGTASPSLDFCLPQGVSIGDVIMHVTAYLQRQPQNDAFVASPAVTMALNHYYPCRGRASARR
ncbi:MAG: hypothetical protein EA357_03060 [Micavibrio sp.]|nr:MAG: hypothetical protein EA357_03060 [Micavibrio sp.]